MEEGLTVQASAGGVRIYAVGQFIRACKNTAKLGVKIQPEPRRSWLWRLARKMHDLSAALSVQSKDQNGLISYRAFQT